MNSLSGGLLYITLALIEVLGGSPEFDADYVQAGVPVAVLELRQVPDPERDIYTLAARPFPAVEGADGATSAVVLEEAVTYRIEESDLIATNYLVYPPGASLPGVAPLAPILSQLRGGTARPAEIGGAPLLLDLTSDVEFTLGDDDAQPEGTLLVFYRGPFLIVSAPELDLFLIVEPVE